MSREQDVEIFRNTSTYKKASEEGDCNEFSERKQLKRKFDQYSEDQRSERDSNDSEIQSLKQELSNLLQENSDLKRENYVREGLKKLKNFPN